MKCIHCSHDADYKKRQSSGGHCFNCGRGYAFEPKTDTPRISDPFFQNTIQKVSEKNQLFFTERQLWYELNRGLLHKKDSNIFGSGLFIFLMFLLCTIIGSENYTLIFMIGACLVAYILYKQFIAPKMTVHTPPLSFSDFRENYLFRWIKAHGRPDMLLNSADEAPRLKKEPNSSDFAPYSFDQVVVTDSLEVAHLLVANNFHFDYKCALLSLDGYPVGMADTILQMLRQNPDLTVFALHDASIEGCRTALRLREPKWFPDQQIKIVDLGMFPHHAEKMKLQPQATAKTVPAELQALLKPEEVQWLEKGRKGELEALSPMRLMRILSRGMGLTKKMLEEHNSSGLALPFITAGLAGGLIVLNEELFDEERKKNKESNQDGGGGYGGYVSYDSWDDSWGDDYG